MSVNTYHLRMSVNTYHLRLRSEMCPDLGAYIMTRDLLIYRNNIVNKQQT